MNKKIILIISFLLLGLISLGAVSAADISVEDQAIDDMAVTDIQEDTVVEDMVVNDVQEDTAIDEVSASEEPINDDVSKLSANEGNFTELENLVSGEDKTGIITLEKNYTKKNGGYSDGIIIHGHDLIIQGAQGKEITIDANYYGCIFTVVGNNITIKNIKFINGGDVNCAGAIYWSYREVNGSIVNCSFVNCSAGHNGGAVYWDEYSNNGFIDGCSFVNCSAGDFGGAVYWDDYANNGTLCNCNFVNCSSFSLGVVYWGGYQGKLSNCKFTSCFSVDGGAIYWDSVNGSISDSSFVNCSSEYSGGAIYLDTSGILSGCNFTGCSANRLGVAIYVEEDDTQISNCNFIKNNVSGSNKRTIYNEADDLIVKYCTFDGKFNRESYDIQGNKATIIPTPYNATVTISQSGSYYQNKTIYVKLISSKDKSPIKNRRVTLVFSNNEKVTVTTYDNGIASYKVPFNPGTYTVTVESASSDVIIKNNSKISAKIVKAPATISPTNLTTMYQGKAFQVKVVNSKTKKGISGVKLKLKVYTGKKYKTATITTASNGIAKYNVGNLAIGTHKVVVSSASTTLITAKSKTSSIKITKASYSIIAPKVMHAYKTSGTFRVTVKNKASGKVLKGVKVSIKVYTGKKYKIYTVKTNAKGIASLSTKALSKGTHNVVVSIKANKNYKASSAKSSIKILKSKIKTVLSGYVTKSIFDSWGSYEDIYLNVNLMANNKRLSKNVKFTLGWNVYSTFYSFDVTRNTGSTVCISPGDMGYTVNPSSSGWIYIEMRYAGDTLYNSSFYRLYLQS